MATRHELWTEQIILMLTGGEPSIDSTYDFREVLAHVEQAHSAIIKQDWFGSKNMDRDADGVNGTMIVTYENVPLQPGPENAYKYCLMPSQLIGLPNDRAFSDIRVTNGKSMDIIQASKLDTYKYGYNAAISNRLLAVQRGTRIEVHIPKGSPVKAPNSVSIDIVSADPNTTDTAIAAAVISQVLRIMAVRRKSELDTVDGVDDTRNG